MIRKNDEIEDCGAIGNSVTGKVEACGAGAWESGSGVSDRAGESATEMGASEMTGATAGAAATGVLRGWTGSGVTEADCTGVPQFVQKRLPSSNDLPQFVQKAIDPPSNESSYSGV
jgi:hypothetical protein